MRYSPQKIYLDFHYSHIDFWKRYFYSSPLFFLDYRMFKKLKSFWKYTMSQVAVSKEKAASMSISQLKKEAIFLHPVGYYILANKLFHDGNKDESILWFYVGSLRYRYFLSSVGDDPFHPENELFGKVQFEIGGVILNYAGGDPDFWGHQINEADKWDDENFNIFYSKKNNPEELVEIKNAMQDFRRTILKDKESIISQRIENNAEVRVPH